MLDRLKLVLARLTGGRGSASAPKIHMLHVPKTGGTAIMEALRPFAAEHHIVFEPHAVSFADIPDQDRVFVFLRHPVDRFVSGFNSRLRCGRPRYSAAWTPAEARSFSHFSTPNALAESLASSNAEIAERARAAMSGIRFVSDSFTQWFGSIENVRERRRQIILLGLQSCLDDDFEFLVMQLGIPGETSLPRDEVLSHRTPRQFEKTLSPAGRRNISDWYADDIAFYEEFVKLRREWFGLPDAPGQRIRV